MQLKKASVLVVDDDPDVLTAVRLLLRPQVKEIVTEKNPENLPKFLSQNSFDVILLDMNFVSSINTGNEGLFWLRNIKSLRPETAVIMITAYGHIDLAIKCLKEGAFDFVVKPWHNEKLLTTLSEAISGKGTTAAKNAMPEAPKSTFGTELLGESEAM